MYVLYLGKALDTAKFAKCSEIIVSANLSGGKGDVAWQHAQLFRTSTNEKDNQDAKPNFRITFEF